MRPRRSRTSAVQRDSVQELAAVVGHNLRRLRTGRGHSLGSLAELAGVSRAMLSQIESQRSVPTIGLLWKISQALGVPFSALTTASQGSGTVLLPADKAKILTSSDGSFTSRALFPFSERRVEFYKLTLAPHAIENAAAHAPGTLEDLTVVSGEVEIGIGEERHVLRADDAIHFTADVPHFYRNCGAKTAVMYLVMTYVERTE